MSRNDFLAILDHKNFSCIVTPPPGYLLPPPPCVVWLKFQGAADVAHGAANMACGAADMACGAGPQSDKNHFFKPSLTNDGLTHLIVPRQ